MAFTASLAVFVLQIHGAPAFLSRRWGGLF